MNVPIERMPYAAHELYVFPWFPQLSDLKKKSTKTKANII